MSLSIPEINESVRKQNMRASIVQSIAEDETSPVIIDNFPAKNGSLSCKIKRGDKEYILAHSAYDPEQEAERMVQILDFSRHSLILVFGLGLGYQVEKILSRASLLSRVVIIEPDRQIYDNLLRTREDSKILTDKRVMLLIGLNIENTLAVLASFIKKYTMDLTTNMQYIALNYYNEFHQNVMQIVKEINSIVLFSWRGLGNCHLDHNIGVLQSVLNIEEIMANTGIDNLRGVYSGKSAIIVSAGPSLKKNIHLLKDAMGKALIVAVDAVVEKLLLNNIVPDVVVSMERIRVFEDIFDNMKTTIPREVVLAVPTLTQVDTLKVFRQNKKIFCFQQEIGTQEYLNGLFGKGLLANGSAAAYTALSLIEALGFSKVAFVGQDLAYGENMEIYCDGISKVATGEEQKRLKDNGYLVLVKDYQGKDIYSNFLWKDQLVTFSYFIMAHRIKVYDATEGGAQIDGAENITLEKYLDSFCRENIEALNTVIEKMSEPLSPENRKQALTAAFTRMDSDYKRFLDIGERLDKQLHKLQGLYQKHVVAKHVPAPGKVAEAAAVIQDTQCIIEDIDKDKVLHLYYQGLVAAFKKEINQIGKTDYYNQVIRHIEVHLEYVQLINDVFKFNLDCFLYSVHHLEKLLRNEKTEDNIVTIITHIVEENGIDPSFVLPYFKGHQEAEI
ncbi:MAG: motility associated factor glycosyltransferase family protein [Bacillota bacterium]